MFNLEKIVRENILKLTPYSSARDEFKKDSSGDYIFLDANENDSCPLSGKKLNRYPDPKQAQLRQAVAKIKNLKEEEVFLGNGSDEIVDLLIRIFCEPGKDKILITPPTYGMYKVSADINDVDILKVPFLKDDKGFTLDNASLINLVKQNKSNLKIIFLCSPNNPTGECLERAEVKNILNEFDGIVVVDEAYIDFSKDKSMLELIKEFPNLVVCNTFSKAWGLAGARLGAAFSSNKVVELLDKIKPPYNINSLTAETCLKVINASDFLEISVDKIANEKKRLTKELGQIPIIKKIYPSDANFLLAEFTESSKVFNFLIENKIVVRDRSKEILCENCLRITVGSKSENDKLLEVLKAYK